MFFKQRTNEDASISYFFGCAGYGKAVAVDVLAGDEQWFADAAKKNAVTITQVTIRTSMQTTTRVAGRSSFAGTCWPSSRAWTQHE
jgi:hypothetical protein